MNAFWLVVCDILDPFKVDFNKVWEAHSGSICWFLQMEWGERKNVVMGDDCGCQNLEPSSNNLVLCGCCDCHKHFHVMWENDIILDHAKRNMMGNIVVAKITTLTKDWKKLFLLLASSKLPLKTIFYNRSHCMFSNNKYYCSSHWFDYKTFMSRVP
jgi:hypothetical protein